MGLFTTKGEEDEIAAIRSGSAQKQGQQSAIMAQLKEQENAKARGLAADARQAEMAAKLAAGDARARAQFAQYPDVLAQLDAESRPSPVLTAIGGAIGKAKDTLFPRPAPPPPAPAPINPEEIAKKKSPIMGMLASR